MTKYRCHGCSMTCTLETPIEPIYCPMGRGVSPWEKYFFMAYIPYPMLMRFTMNNFRLGISEDFHKIINTPDRNPVTNNREESWVVTYAKTEE